METRLTSRVTSLINDSYRTNYIIKPEFSLQVNVGSSHCEHSNCVMLFLPHEFASYHKIQYCENNNVYT